MDQRDGDMLKYISLIYRKTQIYLNGETRELELSSGLAPFIMITCENGKMPQNRFCELLDISKGTVAKMLAKLEEQGYVGRTGSAEDGRSVDVYPTEKALAVYPRLVEIGQVWTGELTAGMTELEKEIFFQLVRKSAGNISRYFE